MEALHNYITCQNKQANLSQGFTLSVSQFPHMAGWKNHVFPLHRDVALGIICLMSRLKKKSLGMANSGGAEWAGLLL